MTSNANTNVVLPNLAFPTSNVRGAFIRYSVHRLTSTTELSESGIIIVTYNPSNPTNNKWEISREYDGNTQITFTITDVGQVEFSTTVIGGINHTGEVTYTAQALLNS